MKLHIAYDNRAIALIVVADEETGAQYSMFWETESYFPDEGGDDPHAVSFADGEMMFCPGFRNCCDETGITEAKYEEVRDFVMKYLGI